MERPSQRLQESKSIPEFATDQCRIVIVSVYIIKVKGYQRYIMDKIPTCNVRSVTPALSPNHVRVALMNSNPARKAINVASTAPIMGAPIHAPSENASIALLAWLYLTNISVTKVENLHVFDSFQNGACFMC